MHACLSCLEAQLKKLRDNWSEYPPGQLTSFPDDPTLLPKPVYDHAYVPPQVPQRMSSAMIDHLHMVAPQRKTHRTCRDAPSQANVLNAVSNMFGRQALNMVANPELEPRRMAMTQPMSFLPLPAPQPEQPLAPTPTQPEQPVAPTTAQPEQKSVAPINDRDIAVPLPAPTRMQPKPMECDDDIENDELIMRQALENKGKAKKPRETLVKKKLSKAELVRPSSAPKARPHQPTHRISFVGEATARGKATTLDDAKRPQTPREGADMPTYLWRGSAA